jgi:hypothetical protein
LVISTRLRAYGYWKTMRIILLSNVTNHKSINILQLSPLQISSKSMRRVIMLPVRL